MKRKPFERGTFEDVETAERYNEETKNRMKYLLGSLVSVAKQWRILDGKVLDLGPGTGLLAIELTKKIPDMEVIGLDLSDVVLEVAQKNLREIDQPSRLSFGKLASSSIFHFSYRFSEEIVKSNIPLEPPKLFPEDVT